MSAVLQAHLPGNYELSDPESGRQGPPICKGCWEEAATRTTDGLNTAWVSVEGQTMVWWLCPDHAEALKVEGRRMTILKVAQGAVRTPEI
jgi:hypothetical protein